MNTFRNYEVIIPRFKSWNRGIRVKVNERYSLYNFSKPGTYLWREDSPYWMVCLTSKIEEESYCLSSFTKDMTFDEAVAFADRLYNLLKN